MVRRASSAAMRILLPENRGIRMEVERKEIEVRTGGVVSGLVLADEEARDSRCRMSHLEPSAVYHMPHVGVGQGLLPRRKERIRSSSISPTFASCLVRGKGQAPCRARRTSSSLRPILVQKILRGEEKEGNPKLKRNIWQVAKRVDETSEREEKKKIVLRIEITQAKMARNEEKAQSMLNWWWAFKSGDLDKKERKRPYLASKCNNTIACEKWRLQILHEIGQKVQEIQSGTSATPFNWRLLLDRSLFLSRFTLIPPI